MKYVIKLPKRAGYLCHAGTNRVVIYDEPTGYPIGMDVMACNGERVSLEGDALHDVFVSGWYENNIDEIECPIKSLHDFKDFFREYDEPTVYLP
jgi:hypothetical protein